MEKKKVVHKIEPKVMVPEEPKPEEKVFVVSENIKFEPIKEDEPPKQEKVKEESVKETPPPEPKKFENVQVQKAAPKTLSLGRPPKQYDMRSSSVAVTKLDQSQMKELQQLTL